MNLINKLTEKKKYVQPNVELIELNGEDILTSSGEQAEIGFAKKTKKETKIEEPKELTFFEKYPDGLPVEVLKLIDFKHFGAILKQQQLLPPSYDRKPAEIDIFLDAENIASVELVFKSKNSSSYRVLNIHKYNVAYSKNRSYALTVNPQISNVWCRFAQNVMWAWERGYNYALVSPEKNVGTYRKLRVNEEKINKLKEIEDECQHFSYFISN